MTTNTYKRLRWLFATAVLVLIITGCGFLTSSQDARVEETGGNISRGEDLVRQNGCMACHSIPNMGSVQDGYGPDLDGFAHRRLIGGSAENTPDVARAIITNDPELMASALSAQPQYETLTQAALGLSANARLDFHEALYLVQRY